MELGKSKIKSDELSIWCISKYASLPEYGAAARLYLLAREFAKNVGEVVLITSDSNHLANYPKSKKRYNYSTLEKVKVCWIKTAKYKNTASLARVFSWFSFEFHLFRLNKKQYMRPDVVIVSSLSLLSIIYGFYLKKKFKSTLVFEIRDIWPLTLTEEGGFSKWHPLSLLLGYVEKFGYRKSDLIVGTMPRLDLHVKNILGHEKDCFCSPIGFDKEDIEASGKFSNFDKFQQMLPNDKIVIGYAGSMGISNALGPFIECIEEYEENHSVFFALIGDGDLKEEYSVRLKENKNVIFIPKVPQQQVQAFLECCDVLYLSTHKSEVWKYGQSMNKVVQYMLSGKPVLASYSGFPSMINEANSGLIVPANSKHEIKSALKAICELSEDERSKMGERGRKWIWEKRTYEVLASEYLLKLRQTLENKY